MNGHGGWAWVISKKLACQRVLPMPSAQGRRHIERRGARGFSDLPRGSRARAANGRPTAAARCSRPVLQDAPFILSGPASLSVRHPDVLHLRGMAEEIPPFALLAAGPVAGFAVAAPRPLHVPGRKPLDGGGALAGAEVPDRLHVVMPR